MSRRVSLPGASELFRPTSTPDQPEEEVAGAEPGDAEPSRARTSRAPGSRPASRPAASRRGKASGRVRHDEKITVYLSTDELVGLETARITLRRLGVGADRGRIVRAAVALALADLEERGAESALTRTLDADRETDETRK